MSDHPPPSEKPQRRPLILGQVSPWRDPTHSILLTFCAEGSQTPLVRVMVTNQNPNLVGSKYQLGTEYWHAVRSLPAGQRLFMSFAHAAWSVAEHDRYLAELPSAYSAPQEAKGLWTTKAYTPPSDNTHCSYSAQDPDAPDDPRARIGLMLVFDATNGLCRTVWYKASEPATGYVWHDGTSPVNGLLWTPAESLATFGWSFVQGKRPG